MGLEDQVAQLTIAIVRVCVCVCVCAHVCFCVCVHVCFCVCVFCVFCVFCVSCVYEMVLETSKTCMLSSPHVVEVHCSADHTNF